MVENLFSFSHNGKNRHLFSLMQSKIMNHMEHFFKETQNHISFNDVFI